MTVCPFVEMAGYCRTGSRGCRRGAHKKPARTRALSDLYEFMALHAVPVMFGHAPIVPGERRVSVIVKHCREIWGKSPSGFFEPIFARRT